MKHEWPIDTKVGPVTQALIDGRRSLVANGWCQSTSLDGQGRMCAWGAIVYGKTKVACYNAVSAELRLALPEAFSHETVPYYNDHPTTTFDDILALYDRAIARARSKGI